MKKKIFGIALLAISFVTFTSAAQDKTENKSQTSGSKTEKPRGNKKAVRDAVNPFEGLTLTDAQQSKLKEVTDKQKAQRTEKKKEAGKQREQARQERKTKRSAYLKEVKAILTPEQYVTFLENAYNSPRLDSKQRIAKRSGKSKVAKGKKEPRNINCKMQPAPEKKS